MSDSPLGEQVTPSLGGHIDPHACFTSFPRATVVILLAVLVAFFVAGQAYATSIRVTLAQLSASSPLVVRGNVERIDSAWAPDRRIESTVYVRVSEALRGDLAAGGLIPVLIEGGRVGRIAMFSSEDPTFTVGEDVLVFLNADETGTLRVTDNAQGKFKIKDNQAINEAWRQQTAVEPLEDALREQKLKNVALAPCGADCAGTTVVPGVDTPAYQWNGERWCDSNPMSEVYLVNPTGGFEQAIINGANSWSQAGREVRFPVWRLDQHLR